MELEKWKTDTNWSKWKKQGMGWVNIASVSLRHLQSASADIERMWGRKLEDGNGEMKNRHELAYMEETGAGSDKYIFRQDPEASAYFPHMWTGDGRRQLVSYEGNRTKMA